MTATPRPDRTAAQARAAAAWAELRAGLATVTPSALGRIALGTIVTLVVGAFIVGTWPTMLPFALGGLLAYAVLPVVDGLDRFMPRALAAALSMLGVVAAIVGVFVVVVPPLVSAILQLSGAVPDPSTLETRVNELLATLPDSSRAVVAPVVLDLVAAGREALAGASGGLRDVLPAALQAALGVVGAILGLLVLPAWILTLLSEKQRTVLAVDRRTAGWLRPDLWAIVRMFDRAAGTYLRGYVVVAFLIGVATWIGLQISHRLGGPDFPGALALSTFAGATQVIPEIGPLLGLIPALLLLLADPQKALVYVAAFIAAKVIVGATIGDRLMEGRLNVPAAILIPGVVVLGQLGILWLLLSAPILAFGTDLVRYLHGRLSEPPRPAGVLPGEPLPVASKASAAAVPAVYRSRLPSPGSAASVAAAPARGPRLGAPAAAGSAPSTGSTLSSSLPSR